MSKTTTRRASWAASYFFLTLVGITTVFPLLWMISTSLKSPSAGVMDLTHLVPESSQRIEVDDLPDAPGFCRWLADDQAVHVASISHSVWSALSPAERTLMQSIVSKGDASRDERSAMIASLNSALAAGVVSSTGKDQMVLSRNRASLQSAYPGQLRKPHRLHWENYATVITETGFARACFNSVVVTSVVTAGVVTTSSLAAYAFSRLEFPGRDRLFFCYLSTMMIPGAVLLIPLFILLRQLGWIDTYYGLAIPPMFSAYGVFMLRQFFKTLPRELEDAAVIDGCSSLRILWHVILPLSKPALAALSILTFIGTWRSLMWPLIVTHSPTMFTLPVALSQFQDMYGMQWVYLMAGSVILILPMIAVFIAGQRFIVQGLQMGAIKG